MVTKLVYSGIKKRGNHCVNVIKDVRSGRTHEPLKWEIMLVSTSLKWENHDRLNRLRLRRPSKVIVILSPFLRFSHEVLYWLHHLLSKYVMLLQLGLASHD